LTKVLVYAVVAFLWWDGSVALVTILLHFHCTRVHSRFMFKNIAGQISIFGKPEIRLELKLEHWSFYRIRL